MRGDRVPIRSVEFRDFWVLDISQPSHSTREAGGPSTVGVGIARTPSGEVAMPSFTNPATSSCLRCFAHTILLEARHCLFRTLVLLTGHHGWLCRSVLRRKRKRRAFRVLRGKRECFFTPRCGQIRIRSVKTLTLASPGHPCRGFFFVRRSAALCPAFAVREKQSPPAAGLWPGLTAMPDSTRRIYAPNPAEDVFGRFSYYGHNLLAVAAKLTSFAAFY
jgi:hypothetical protein